MTHKEFEAKLKEKYPLIQTSQHGGYVGQKTKVSIVFSPGGKVYNYSGTYGQILEQLGIKKPNTTPQPMPIQPKAVKQSTMFGGDTPTYHPVRLAKSQQYQMFGL